jgi:carbonic anhydrase/acetyltransferase-like protein (isoleucine patch superfamily)
MIRSFNKKTPEIAKSAFVSEAAYIVGDVKIGKNASVWPGAVLRGDLGCISIGQGTAVEDNCVIHSGTPSSPVGNVTIGAKVIIGHGAVVHSKSIGDSVLIGMNSTILHDVEIGSYCLIAAGCLIRPGMQIPDKSFVTGIPGKISGPAPEQLMWWIQDGAQHYLDLATAYKAQGL